MASGTRVHRKIQEASLGREEHKISGRKTKNRSRRSFAEVSLDNADALIDGATETIAPTHCDFWQIESLHTSGLRRLILIKCFCMGCIPNSGSGTGGGYERCSFCWQREDHRAEHPRA